MSNSIALIDTTTYGACSAGVARVNENHGDPSKFCLIGDILPKLVKRPVCVSCPLLAPSNRYPVTYTAKVLHGDGASGVLRFLHEPFADQVIGVLLVTSLFARNFLEFSLCCLRLFPLKVAATMGIDPAFGLNNVPTVNDSVTVRCDIDNSQVYTQCFGNRFGFWNLHFAGRGKIKAAFMNAQITLAPHSNQQFPLTFPANKWDARPPSNGPDRYLRFVQLPRQNTVVVGDCAMRSKNTHYLMVNLIRISHFCDAAHNNLSGQGENITNCLVCQVVKRKLTKRMGVPGFLADYIAGIVGNFQRLQKGNSLVGIWEKFNLCCQFHI